MSPHAYVNPSSVSRAAARAARHSRWNATASAVR